MSWFGGHNSFGEALIDLSTGLVTSSSLPMSDTGRRLLADCLTPGLGVIRKMPRIPHAAGHVGDWWMKLALRAFDTQ